MNHVPDTPPPRGVFAWWATLTCARPWVTLVVVAILTVAALLAALRLKPATGVQDMLADDQPAALAFGKVIDRFALIDDLIILVRDTRISSGSQEWPERLMTRLRDGGSAP